MGSGTSRQLTYNALQLPLGELSKLVFLSTPTSYGAMIASKTITYSTSSLNVSVNVGTTADLYVGCPVVSGANLAAGSTVASIIDTGTFTLSNLPTSPGVSQSATFTSPNEFIMFKPMRSSGTSTFYQVPEGKTFLVLSFTSAIAGSGLLGYSTSPLVQDCYIANYRYRTHLVPTGATYYGGSSTDYNSIGASTLTYPYMFPSGTYPFIRLGGSYNSASVIFYITGVEI